MPLSFPVDEYIHQTSEQIWLIDGLLPVGGKLLLYGDPKVGKSYHALQLARAAAGLEKEWLGFRVSRPGRVLYVQLDTPRSLWATRLATLRGQGHLFDGVEIADRETLDAWPFDILRSDHADKIASLVSSLKPTVVILDVLKETNRLKENDNTDQQIVVSALEAACKPAAMVFIAHARKPLPDDVEPDLIADCRGASYLPGSVDTIMRATARGMWYVGRAIEGGVVWCERQSNGLWRPTGSREGG